MPKYIDADKLDIGLLETFIPDIFARQKRRFTVGEVRTLLQKAPAADVVEVVHGEWIPVIDEPSYTLKMPMLIAYKCSICGRYETEEESYCNCGAKMDGERRE